ncbi:MAG: transglycosylase SLT domain-containing protein [Thiohalobacterales bacterium]|nr:transglycosylase SLT domain-containing protein [Thiohalobacterales bacterium]
MKLHDALEAISQKAFPRRHALERELADLREQHAHTLTELGGVRDELLQTRAQDDQQLADLKQQLADINTERKGAEARARQLESSLAEATTRQQGAEQQIESLEQRLTENREECERSVTAERKAAEARLRKLEFTLAEAHTRQQDADRQIAALEQHLATTRRQHEQSMDSARESLQNLQSDQENLYSQQSVLTRSFHDVGMQLLEGVRQQSRPGRFSRLQTTLLAALLFVSGALLGGLAIRSDVLTADLGPLQQGMLELQRAMQANFENNNELLKILTERLDREMTSLQQLPAAPAPREPQSTDSPARLHERQRRDLALLGFDTDKDIDSLLERFRLLYLPVRKGQPAPTAAEVDAALGEYAELLRKDINRYKVDAGVLAAIRLASKRTGVEFAYLMELAATESSFNPRAKAATSTAVGLYQFKEDTWLDTIKTYGHKYGLADIRRQIVYHVDEDGVSQPTIEDPQQLTRALDLRLQPRLSALLAAEHERWNPRQLLSALERKPDRTALYLSHFLGATGAISFLKALAEDPERIAREIFPGPARRNRSIFQTKADKPRTVAEIYRLFARKFNTNRFRDGDSG